MQPRLVKQQQQQKKLASKHKAEVRDSYVKLKQIYIMSMIKSVIFK